MRLFRDYGTDWKAVAGGDALVEGTLPGTDYFVSEVRHAVRSEFALTLADVVMRRLDLGSAERPTEAALGLCADVVAHELGWDRARREREIARVLGSYPFASPASQFPVARA